MNNDFPPDKQFEDTNITKIEPNADGWIVTGSHGWSFFIPGYANEPKVGSTVRLYGKGIGYRFRGMFIDGEKVFYRTKEEDDERHEIEMYGADAADWLKRWDDGRTVWSIEMGGLGPGYEQCIHITAAEILRHMLAANYDPAAWEDKEFWKQDREKIEQYGFKNPVIEKLGLSGAQWGAAVNLACHLYQHGPRKVMNDDRVKDRRIQVTKNFPAVV